MRGVARERISWERSGNLVRGAAHDRHRSTPSNLSLDGISVEHQIRGPRNSTGRESFSDESETGSLGLGSMDISYQNMDFSNVPVSPRSSSSSQSAVSLSRVLVRTSIIMTEEVWLHSLDNMIFACSES